jgi:hypothetical protein
MVKHTRRRHVKKSQRGGAHRQELEALGFQPEEIDYLISYADKKEGMDIMPTIDAFLAQGMSPSKIVEEIQEGDDTTIESPHSFYSNAMGKKKSRKSKSKKSRKSKSKKSKTRKQKGGVCYGSGVGANNYDPNFSIYNTRELQLFPYKPN